MKIVFWILLVMVLIPLRAAAIDELVTIDSFRVYINGVNKQVDWDDSSIIANPDSNLELQIRFENGYNSSVTVDVSSTLYDIGGDITRDKSVTLGVNEKKAIVLEYYLPASTQESSYELEIKYDWDFNGTNVKKTKTFDVEVQKLKVELSDVLTNLTYAISMSVGDNTDLMVSLTNVTRSYSDLSQKLQTTQEECGKCSAQLSECNVKTNISLDFIKKYDETKVVLEDRIERESSCQAEKKNMYTQSQVDNFKIDANNLGKQDQKKKDDSTMMWMGVAVAVYIYFKRKSSIVGGKGEHKPITGTWK